MDAASLEALPSVQVPIMYQTPSEKELVIVAEGEFEDEGKTPPRPEDVIDPARQAMFFDNLTESRDMRIYDARPQLARFNTRSSLDALGFMHRAHGSSLGLQEFADPARVTSVYYPEVVQLLRDVTDRSADVFIFQHQLRRAGIDQETRVRLPGQVRVEPPAGGAHNDYNRTAALRYLQEALGLPGEAEAQEVLRTRRVSLINVWRSVGPSPVKDQPLAVLDRTSCCKEDLISIRMVKPGHDSGVCGARFSERHRWFYISDMTPQDVLLLKLFDDGPDVAGRGGGPELRGQEVGQGVVPTCHTAFRLPEPMIPKGCPPRQSMEVRAVVVWPPAAAARL